MMSSFEFKGKNVDKAVEKACKELNLTQDEIMYDVLSHGSSGIFGLAGVKKAKIRVNLPEKPQDAVPDLEIADQGAEISNEKIISEEQSFEIEYSNGRPVYTFEENPLDLGRAVLQRIIDSITSDAKVSAVKSSERILFNVTGGNAAILIGKKGQTLEAIQSLVEKIVNKHNNNNDKILVQVDVEGYLETRKVNLERLAARLAEKAKRIRKPISLGQMSAYDRRIVHMTLKDDPGIRTKSRGEGYMRKLVIFPKKNSMHRQHLH